MQLIHNVILTGKWHSQETTFPRCSACPSTASMKRQMTSSKSVAQEHKPLAEGWACSCWRHWFLLFQYDGKASSSASSQRLHREQLARWGQRIWGIWSITQCLSSHSQTATGTSRCNVVNVVKWDTGSFAVSSVQARHNPQCREAHLHCKCYCPCFCVQGFVWIMVARAMT